MLVNSVMRSKGRERESLLFTTHPVMQPPKTEALGITLCSCECYASDDFFMNRKTRKLGNQISI